MLVLVPVFSHLKRRNVSSAAQRLPLASWQGLLFKESRSFYLNYLFLLILTNIIGCWVYQYCFAISLNVLYKYFKISVVCVDILPVLDGPQSRRKKVKVKETCQIEKWSRYQMTWWALITFKGLRMPVKPLTRLWMQEEKLCKMFQLKKKETLSNYRIMEDKKRKRHLFNGFDFKIYLSRLEI